MVLNESDKIVLFLALAWITVIYLRNHNRSSGTLPPGPRKLPLLGNLLNAPRSSPWLQYAEWSKSLGSDVLHLSVAGQQIIILNSITAAIELLEKRSLVYSSRPQFIMMSELMGWDWAISNMPYGEPWRERRKLFTHHFHPSKAQDLERTQTEWVRKMLLQLYERPNDFLSITQTAIGSMVFALAYGIPLQSHDDPFLALANDALHQVVAAGMPGTYLVDFIPILKYLPKWMPGARFQQVAEDFRVLNDKFLNLPFEATVQHMASGTAQPSFTSKCLEENEGRHDSRKRKVEIRDTAAMVFGAGADTTIATVHTLFLALVKHPRVQARAQEELDRVLRGRLPEFRDQADLPYISAIVKETLRWQPPAPVGVPHIADEEDIYESYRIPKNAMVIANSWAMLHDEEIYPDPSEFKPERFLKPDGSLDPEVRDPSTVAFGFGRRICPGSHIALSSVWLTAAMVLSTVEISKALDENGVEIEVEVKYISGLVNHPAPFECAIKARSRAAETLIQSEL